MSEHLFIRKYVWMNPWNYNLYTWDNVDFIQYRPE